jgi:medium-chain acyl-[acyl-carrier-protein] hydrolase
LFCFPYAGGSAGIFRDWAGQIAGNVEVCAIRLPGRERRYSEPALCRWTEVVESVTPILRDLLDLPFVMFGHSMGALLAYETTRALLNSAGVEPSALFVSAHRGPHLPSRKRNLHDLPRDELIAEVKALNGTPPEVFEHEDLLELVMPMLRSDLELVETYACAAEPVLSCPVVAMGGTYDPDISPEELAGWRSVTSGPFKPMLIGGDHFFINSAQANFFPIMRRELASLDLD